MGFRIALLLGHFIKRLKPRSRPGIGSVLVDGEFLRAQVWRKKKATASAAAYKSIGKFPALVKGEMIFWRFDVCGSARL